VPRLRGRHLVAWASLTLIVATVIILLVAATSRRGGSLVRVKISVDPSTRLGGFKDLRGVNCGPLSPRGWDKRATLNLTSRYLELGVRVVRFHDLYPFDELDHIFPDPQADPARPESYNFRELDRHVEAAMRVADTLIFRIGYDWNDPPKNRSHITLDKLSEVAKSIVLHYTRGLWGGYNYSNILWEVWNEPDIGQFWGGTPEEYLVLYEAVARAIKEANPEARVGGPALAYDMGFLDKFLNYTSSRGLPLDFVSWHVYATDPRQVAERAAAVRALMDKYGYRGTPSVLDEWNYWLEKELERFRSPVVASFQAAALTLMQDSPVDIATLYRGDAWTWGGLFHPDGQPGKPFYVWLAYKQLLQAERVRAECKGLYVMAGVRPDGELLLLVCNPGGTALAYSVESGDYRIAAVLAIDDDNNLEPVEACGEGVCRIEPYAVHLVTLVRA